MKHAHSGIAFLAVAGVLAGCAQPPPGPSVAVMPAPDKPFSVFQQEDAFCRQFAQQQIAGTTEAANNAQIGTAALGTVLAAGLGAALGGGQGAAVGAGVGALGGTAIGANQAERGAFSAQQRLNLAYSQCMYAKGNQVPGFAAAPARGAFPPPPPPPPGAAAMPPPPPPPPPMMR